MKLINGEGSGLCVGGGNGRAGGSDKGRSQTPAAARGTTHPAGDVAGKALPAALLSAKLQATIRALAPNYDNLGELGAAVNRILHRDGLPTRFASLIYAVLASNSGVVRLLNAGHMPPLRLRAAPR